MSGPPAESDPRLAQARERMVADQLRARGIADPRVLEVMGAVPRELFVADSERRHAYADEALPIDVGPDDQPALHGRPHDRAPGVTARRPDPRDRHRVRLPGGHPGGARVPRHDDRAPRRPRGDGARARLAELGFGDDVDVRVGDGSLGLPDEGPWDGIIVTAAAPDIPHALRDQLADGARLVIPVGSRDRQILTVVHAPRQRMDRAPGRCLRLRPARRGGRLGPLSDA